MINRIFNTIYIPKTGGLWYLLLCSLAATGQNEQHTRSAMLYLKNGTVLEVEVLSLDDDRVEFYRSDYLTGPVFSVPGIRVDSVRFRGEGLHTFTGTEKNRQLAAYGLEFQKLTTAQLLTDYSHTRGKARGKLPWGIALISVGSSVMVTGAMLAFFDAIFSGDEPGNGAYAATVIAGGVMVGSGIGLGINGGRHNRRLKAIKRELEYRGIDPARSKVQ